MANYKNPFDMHLLHEMALHPIIWDNRLDEYKDSEKKPAVWFQIAEKLQSTPGAVKARFDSIRGSYRRYRTAMNKSLAQGKNGSGDRNLKPPKTYKYAAEAAFLDPVFKMETVVKSMDSDDNASNEVDEDLQESISSVGDSAVLESERCGRKRKASTESDFNTVLVDAVQSIHKLSNSVINSRKNEKVDDLDDDWLFAKSIYLKLKDVPTREAKERFKVRMQSELTNLIFDDSSKQSTNAQCDVQQQAALNLFVAYK